MSPVCSALGLAESDGTFTAGQTVRIVGEVGDRYRVLGIRPDGTVDVYAQAPATGHRTVAAERLRKAKALRT